jgi:PhnB protein
MVRWNLLSKGEITMTVKPTREGFHTVTPYLIVQEAARLIDFMKEAFGATEHFRDTGSGREAYISLHSS